MKQNHLRELLDAGKPSLGTRIESTWPLIVEIIGSLGYYDYVEFVAEYSPFEQKDLENIARAAELSEMSTMIKVDFQNRAYVAQKAMSSGFQAVLLTDHKTADEVRETIHLLRPDTPEDAGRFGYPNRRWIGFQSHLPQMDYAKMVRSTVIALMIEKREAMENIEEICSVPGIDLIQFGPSDFAMSSGWNAAEHRDELKAIEREMIRVAQLHGIQARCEINSWQEAEYYRALGVQHFCMGDELRNNTNYWRAQGKGIRELLANEK